MDIPTGTYLANKKIIPEEIFSDLAKTKHICIDADLLAQLVLRLLLAKLSILPFCAPKLYGYKGENNAYYFLNESQHQLLQFLLQEQQVCTEN
jgi:nitroimidazol reductase NimA-like FMN-containing flavoprotein (pyridoxamine 5'-phosphate oxidase superfamily)